MALQDPQDPTAGLGMPAPWEWPAEFQVDPRAYGIMPMDPAIAPPPDPLQIGGTMGVVENAAAPALAAPPVAQAEVVPPADPFNVLSPIDHTMADLAAGAVQAPPPQPPIAVPSPLGAIDTGVAKVGPAAADSRAENDVEGASSMLAMDPARLQRTELDLETERLDRQREMLEQERANDAMEADRIAKQHVDAVAKAQAETARISNEATAIANTKIVRDRRSGGRRLLDVIMGAVGGLVAGQTGGANQGLALVLKRIDDDVEDQKAELQQRSAMLGVRRNIVGDELARSGDMYKAQELARLAAHDTAIADITTESMKFAPNGTRALQLAKFKYGLMQSRAAAVQALQDHQLKRIGDQAKTEHQLLENAKLRGQLSGAGAAPKVSRAQIRADYGFDPGRDLTDKELDKLIDRKGKIGTQAALVADQERKTEEKAEKAVDKVRELNVGGLKQKDGSEFLARDKAVAGDLTNKLDKAKQVIAIIDEIDSIRDRVGGESSWNNSDDFQRLQVLGEQLLELRKQGTQGMSSDADMDVLRRATGAADVTTFRSIAAGLKTARDRTETAVKSELKSNKFDNWDSLRFPNLYATAAKESQADAQLRAALGGKLSHVDALNVYYRIAGEANVTDPKVRAEKMAVLRRIAKEAPTEDDRTSVEALIKALENQKIGAP